MGTLSSCLKRIGLSKHEAAILRGAADDNIKDGDEAHVAAVRAVSDFIEQLEKERAAIAKQVIKAGGKPTAAPFQFVDLADLTRVLRKPRQGNDGADANRDVTDPAVRWSVAGAVATRFLQGNGFDTITQARAFVAEKLGLGKIEAGTEAAKYADEIIENGVVKAARHIVQKGTLRGAKKDEVYDRLVELYDQQPRLGVRTSTSVREQAYSTPAPLAYVAAKLANVKPGTPVYEPTAGNGMLLINSLADSVVANELNDDRFAMLKQSLPGAHLIQGDATQHDMTRGTVRAVLANPPFGVVKDGSGQSKVFQTAVGYETREIDHAIVFKALDALPDDGTATLIVGGVMGKGDDARKEGYRAKAKREFYANLYNNYKVARHFTVSGDLYEKQGASYPVDVIVISGRGKSERALPAADLPKVYNSWNELKEVLSDETRTVATGNEPAVRTDDGAGQAGQGDAQSMAGSAGRPGAVDGDGVGRPGAVDAAGGQGNGLADTGTQGGGSVAGAAQPGAANSVQSARPGKLAGRGEEQRAGTGNAERPGKLDSGSGSSNALNDRRGQEVETSRQVTYEPRSASAAVGTLVPINMRDAVQNSLNRLEDEVGDLDEFVASRIGMDVDAMQRNFSAEQVDALAMAINNAEHGGGFIIGDQTGIGKGRIVAGMIRYAINQGLTPVFVTEKPNLYADMMRDLADIGMGEMLGYGTDELRVLMTNKDESVPYGANGEYQMPKLGRQADAVMQDMVDNGQVDPKYLAVFTTYSQMQTSAGNMPVRMKAIQAIMPNAYLILDESHNAGGTGAAGGRKTAKQLIAERTNGFVGRSGFMRLLVQQAKASFFSSATYAKRPNVMDLYQSTNMIHAVDKPEQLGDAIARGGVPLQQITAAMLAADGQYMRRERSFHGVKYDTKPVAVDKDAAENMAKAMSEVLNFSRAKEGAIAKLQDEYDAAGAMLTDVGNNAKTAVEGANFGSIMHNLIDQMLLALKTKGAVDEAMAALARGEKVVLTVANTMGSFIADYAREMELSPGQPVNLSFTDLYRKYLEKQRWVKIKAANGDTSMYRLTDDDLGPVTAAYFRRIDDWMKQANFGDAPISPIDYLHAELRKRKINGKAITTDEITGRTATINYEGVTPVLSSRNSSIKTRLKAINGFNNGDIDVLILNQSGSTGLSLHASEKFKDQRQRHMILIQAEKNIDTHMQMLGRTHRTGQVTEGPFDEADAPSRGSIAAKARGIRAKVRALEAEEKRIAKLAKSKSGKVRLETLRRDIARQNARLESMRNAPGFDGDASADANVRTYNGQPATYGLPVYSQLMADIPAELRPAAVLQGKMAKLTANTTASKDSDFAADGVVDFMNDYGGQVAVEYLLDNPEVYHKLGGADMMALSQDEASEDDIRKLTGYIPLLPIKMQEQVYADLVARYKELIQRETELGTNKLEARALDLDAETLASEVADPGKPEKHSLFAAPVVMERVSVKRTSKPMTREQVEKTVSERLAGSNAHAISREMQNQLREKVGEYINKVVAERTERGDEEAKIEAAVDVIRGMLAIANDKLSTYRIGTAHQINLDGQIFYGIVTDVKHHERAANPAAQSAWTVQFALAMADANSVTLPFSQLGEKFKTELIYGTMWGDLASGGNRWVSIPELFDLAQTTGREKRWMVTGNLLSGYAKFPGQLIHYTKQDGSQAQGILMGRAYDYGKTKEMLGARFNKVERILAFFSQALSRSVISDQDNAMRIEQERPGSFIIQVPKSKRAGGHYFLDTQLTDIIGSDFVTVGQNMRANVQGIEKVGEVLRHVLGEQADYFTAMTNKDIANRINDEANQNAGGEAPSARFARPDGKKRDNVEAYDKPHKDISDEEARALEVLKATLLRTESTPGQAGAPAWIDAIQLQTVPDAHARFAATIEKLFGVKIHFVKAEENGRAVGFNGLYAGGRNLFVNTLASEPYSSIIGHEFLHYLAENKPTLFKAFQKIAEPLMAERAEQYAMARMAEYKAAGHKQLKAFELGQEEVYADTFGDLWSDESFWRELAGRKGAKGIVSRIMDQLRQFIGRILGALDGGKRNETDGFYTDDKAIRNAVLDTTQQAMAKRGKWLADASERLAKYMKPQDNANTIEVDGVQRPRMNSEGRPIHPSEDGIRNFWRWFGDSKVVDAQGRPLVVYHGTDAAFDVFDSKKQKQDRGPGFWFTTDISRAERYGAVKQAYLSIKKPGRMTGRTNAAYDAGHDGAKDRGVWVAFSPTQIKSATGNNGDFDPDNSDIRYSRRSVSETLAGAFQQSSPKFANTIRDTFASNEKFSWWDRTFGTQGNKAHKDAQFAKVYEETQAFERDISRMASEAADLAPDLLPKMDSIGDTLKTAKNAMKDAEDSAAISPWIYYGTLAETTFTESDLQNPDAIIAKFGQLLPDDQPLKPLTERQRSLYRQYHAAINKSLDDLAIAEMGRLARVSKLEMADPTLTLAETARFYFEQVAGEIQRLQGALDELKQEQRAEADLLEDAAKDEAAGAEQRKRYAKLLMDMKTKHKAQREAITDQLADLLTLKDGFIGRAEKIKEMQDSGYAPLMRFGKYTVDVTLQDENGKVLTDADGNELRPFFGMFESEAEANAVARELREEFPDHTVTQGILSEREHQLFTGVSPENVELYAKVAGLDNDEAFQRYLKLATANRSAMKRLIHRKGTAGFSFDATRSLASFITSNSRAAASNLHIGPMLEAIAAIDKTKGDVKDEAIKLVEYVRTPQEGGVAIRSMLFFQYLGGSVAAALTNMTQTFTTTLPYLSQDQFGGFKAAQEEIRKAMAMSGRMMKNGASTGDAELDAMLKRATEDGVVAPHEIHMLQGEASRGSGLFANSPIWRSLENKYPSLRYTTRFMDAGKSLWGKFFSLAEQYNRQVAFIAAYNLAKQQGKTKEQAYAMAEKAVTATQFNYQKSDRSNLGRSAVGATLLTFKTFLINYLEFLKRLPPKERAIALAVLVLLSGTQGAPGADDADDIIDTIGQAAGYSTNTKRWKRDMLAGIFGDDEFGRLASDFILHGVGALPMMPLDVQGRLSVGNIIPATSLFKRDNTSAIDEVAELIGPAGGFAKKVYEGTKAVIDGDNAGHALGFVAAPKAISDAYQAVDMLQTGVYRDYRGRKVVDVDAGDAFVKAIGFQPTAVSHVKRAERLVQQDVALFRNVKQDIAERWARGLFEGDKQKVAQARDKLADWNEKNPSMPMQVKNSQVLRRVTEMKKTSGERLVKAAPKEVRGNVGATLRNGD